MCLWDIHIRDLGSIIPKPSLIPKSMMAGVSRAQDLFAIGERVCAIVVGMNPDCTRISVSTAELEPNDGDMLKDKVRQTLYPMPSRLAARTVVRLLQSWSPNAAC